MFVIFFFFFKQKTAYEMRISEWSSDVCSSDLRASNPQEAYGLGPRGRRAAVEGADDRADDARRRGLAVRRRRLARPVGERVGETRADPRRRRYRPFRARRRDRKSTRLKSSH